MDQRRFILFVVLSTAILMGWNLVVMPRFFPPAKRPAAPNIERPKDGGSPEEGPAIAEIPGAELPAEKPAEVKPEPKTALPKFPRDDKILLGSLDPVSGYFLEAELTTQGASVREIRLNDPRYRELDPPHGPLPIVGEVDVPLNGNVPHPFGPTRYRTFQTTVEPVDRELEDLKTSLDRLDWEVINKDPGGSSVTFAITSPDGKLQIRKRYTLEKIVAATEAEAKAARDTESKGYQLGFEITLHNRAKEKQAVTYTVQGPVGVPLENLETGRKYRDLRMGFLSSDGRVKSSSKTAVQLTKEERNGKVEEWKTAVRYIGVDMQYFAALLVPQGDQLKDPNVAVARPEVLRTTANDERNEISVALTSPELMLLPDDSVTQRWSLYAGPKREALLDPFQAGDVVDFGFASPVSRGMLWLLKFFHTTIGLPWGLAIVALTVVVRGCMFPISKRQAASAKKMKEMQPKIAELKKKHGDDKEKFARAQFELFAKHNYNPLAGCLPVFLQLPIFIGLYNALNSAVELRMAPFLYIDNLAAPDALFRFPFTVPFLGNYFNLLPLITVALFIVQQKMFTPPPADEQQAQQMKMMNFMMIFMGFMFYKVPAGLCIYFIASSLWGMGERKLLDLLPAPAGPALDEDGGGGGSAKRLDPNGSRPRENFWSKMLAQADAAGNRAGLSSPARESDTSPGSNGNGRKDKRKKDRR